jgi:anti-sigma-K factor RskA
MAKDPIDLAGFDVENTGGLLSGFLAEEDEFDRRSLWRLGSWGVAAVTAVIVALMANQSSIGSQRDQVAAADLARQSQQIQTVAKDSQNEARRLTSAIDTLNGDRDRL